MFQNFKKKGIHKMDINNNMENKTIVEQKVPMKGIALSTSGLVNQIPDDERGMQKATVAINTLGDLILAVPENEQAENEGLDELAEVRKLGCFTPIVGMRNILNVLDDKIYARIYVASDGTRFIEFCEQYSDGRFSKKMRVKQSSLLMGAKYHFVSKGIPEAKVKNRVANFVLDATVEYLGKFDGPDEPLDVIELLNVLIEVRTALPVCEEGGIEQEPELFYQTFIQKMKDESLMWLDEHKAYYTLEECHIACLAKAMDMKQIELLRKLKEYGFLYLTPSSKGYQTNVRFRGTGKTPEEQQKNSFTAWMYCIYKLEYFVNSKSSQN